MTVYTLDSTDQGGSEHYDLDEILVNITRVTGFYWDFDELLSQADIAELGEDLIDLVDILDTDLHAGRSLPQPWQPATSPSRTFDRRYHILMNSHVDAIEQLVCFYYSNFVSLTTNELARLTNEVITLVGLVDYHLRQGLPLPEQWSVCR